MALVNSSSYLSLFSATSTFIRPKVRANVNNCLGDAFSSSKSNANGIEGCNAQHPFEGLAITSIVRPRAVIRSSVVRASPAPTSLQQTENSAENLLGTLLSMVEGTDRGAKLSNEEHERVARIVSQLERLCMPEPLKSPFILGEWDVEYCSNPTSPGGYYRSAIGRLLLRTKEMTQSIQAPDFVGNKVAFSAFNAIDGEVSLEGFWCSHVTSQKQLVPIWSQTLHTFCQSSKEVEVPNFFNKIESSINSLHVIVNPFCKLCNVNDPSKTLSICNNLGKFTPLDNKWIEITFDPPSLKFGSFNFQYGGQSTVKIAIIYLDERIRLGRGSRGSIFIFKRRG